MIANPKSKTRKRTPPPFTQWNYSLKRVLPQTQNILAIACEGRLSWDGLADDLPITFSSNSATPPVQQLAAEKEVLVLSVKDKKDIYFHCGQQ